MRDSSTPASSTASNKVYLHIIRQKSGDKYLPCRPPDPQASHSSSKIKYMSSEGTQEIKNDQRPLKSSTLSRTIGKFLMYRLSYSG